MKDYYAVLGVASDASGEALKQAYRKKASQLHPDRNAAPDAAERFRDVQEAYETLSEPTRRYDYDENRRRNLLEKPLETAREIWKNYLEGVLQ
ncbi:MAG: DnaJ domain-containing protein [Candidatus Accumulibacter sp.]|uniref:DnaJ domain-containing protein n=1 Tax=Accumulibacter sp. TaxID=2053492 RepID=UPI0019EEB893|nr:DnaJ domain-containing protein [Accumulibacter sp.]MBE2257380.1 DnaJ domain-containing protein [Paracoccaceae bacterium]MCB1941844.1 DnaJ domain-containing protein [Accumulibacter sp.]MCP5247238.1 DnaJ domain-containing protein [Accumulibacter sp.]